MLQGLSELIKQGRIGRLEVINLAQCPDLVEELGIRALPWVRHGPFEFEGLHRQHRLQTVGIEMGKAPGARPGSAFYGAGNSILR